jgi:hypothetical protein
MPFRWALNRLLDRSGTNAEIQFLKNVAAKGADYFRRKNVIPFPVKTEKQREVQAVCTCDADRCGTLTTNRFAMGSSRI